MLYISAGCLFCDNYFPDCRQMTCPYTPHVIDIKDRLAGQSNTLQKCRYQIVACILDQKSLQIVLRNAGGTHSTQRVFSPVCNLWSVTIFQNPYQADYSLVYRADNTQGQSPSIIFYWILLARIKFQQVKSQIVSDVLGGHNAHNAHI
jgi:hypothetical protein